MRTTIHLPANWIESLSCKHGLHRPNNVNQHSAARAIKPEVISEVGINSSQPWQLLGDFPRIIKHLRHAIGMVLSLNSIALVRTCQSVHRPQWHQSVCFDITKNRSHILMKCAHDFCGLGAIYCRFSLLFNSH